MTDGKVFALIDKDTDQLEELISITDKGTYTRVEGDWEPLEDDGEDDPLEGLWAVEVDDDVTDVFDDAQRTQSALSVADIESYGTDPKDFRDVKTYSRKKALLSDGRPNLRGVYAGLTWEETIQPEGY